MFCGKEGDEAEESIKDQAQVGWCEEGQEGEEGEEDCVACAYCCTQLLVFI
jgi:hypothetical protein